MNLTEDQTVAAKAIVDFFLDKSDDAPQFMVLEGYAGTGKTTVLKHILNTLANRYELNTKIAKAAGISTHHVEDELPALTATTNKAVEALESATNQTCKTIFSLLGMRVLNSAKGGLTPMTGTSCHNIVIDEASFIDDYLLKELTSNPKMASKRILFVGDPAQLNPIKCKNSTPVFNQEYPTVSLTEVVRQDEGNQIIEASTAFRNVVKGSNYEPFTPNGKEILYLGQESFNQEIVNEFTRESYTERDAKILSWTNARVHHYNSAVKQAVEGVQSFQEGDYAVCNSYFKLPKVKKAVPTDSIVQIIYTGNVYNHEERWNLPIAELTFCSDNELADLHFSMTALIDSAVTFSYKSEHYSTFTDVKASNKIAKTLSKLIRETIPTQMLINGSQSNELEKLSQKVGWVLRAVTSSTADLRPMYSCTINKSQGSTYRKVFIDLDDVNKCKNNDLVNRMLYVAFSRASEQVIVTGDIV